MNKLIIGLLLAAAGTGAFFLLRNKKSSQEQKIDKELIIGQWKQSGDSSGIHRFAFQKEGILLKAVDSVRPDTAKYSWSEKTELIIKLPGDSVSKAFSVIKLSKDSLQLRSVDSIRWDFIRIDAE
jgi:hypothetical protein